MARHFMINEDWTQNLSPAPAGQNGSPARIQQVQQQNPQQQNPQQQNPQQQNPQQQNPQQQNQQAQQPVQGQQNQQQHRKTPPGLLSPRLKKPLQIPKILK